MHLGGAYFHILILLHPHKFFLCFFSILCCGSKTMPSIKQPTFMGLEYGIWLTKRPATTNELKI